MLRSPPKRGPKSGAHFGRIIEEPFAKNLVAAPFLPGDFVEAAHLAGFFKWPGREILPPLANGTAAAWQRGRAPAPRARAAPADRPRRPAVIREQLAGKKRSHRHRPEHQEIVEGLNLVAFLRQMRFQHQRGGADKAEIPTDTSGRGPCGPRTFRICSSALINGLADVASLARETELWSSSDGFRRPADHCRPR